MIDYKMINDLAIEVKKDESKLPAFFEAIEPYLQSIFNGSKFIPFCYKDDFLQELRLDLFKFLKSYEISKGKFLSYYYNRPKNIKRSFIGYQVSSIYIPIDHKKNKRDDLRKYKSNAMWNMKRDKTTFQNGEYEITPLVDTLPIEETNLDKAKNYIEDIKPLLEKILTKKEKEAFYSYLEKGEFIKDRTTKQNKSLLVKKVVRKLRGLTLDHIL